MVDSAIDASESSLRNDFIRAWNKRATSLKFAKHNKKDLERLNKALAKAFRTLKEVREIDKRLDRAYDTYKKGRK